MKGEGEKGGLGGRQHSPSRQPASADLQPGQPSSRMELYSVRSTYFVIIKVRFLFQIEVLSRLRRLEVGSGGACERGKGRKEEAVRRGDWGEKRGRKG